LFVVVVGVFVVCVVVSPSFSNPDGKQPRSQALPFIPGTRWARASDGSCRVGRRDQATSSWLSRFAPMSRLGADFGA